jgi:hypothetical protein
MRVLVLAANPGQTGRLVLEEEKRLIEEAHKRSSERPNFKLKVLDACRWGDMVAGLRDFQPQIVHFMGHGEGDAGIVLVDDDGAALPMTGDRWAELFSLYPVDCVVLNACSTAGQAEEIFAHVDCVVGMWQKIGDRSGQEFAAGFYGEMFAGRGYERAFEVGKASIVSRIDGMQPTLLFRERREKIDLEAPGRRMPIESKFYIERPTNEVDACREIVRSGALIRIKGPIEFGKSSLMARVVNQAEADGAKTVSINFREIGPESLVSLKAFLRFFCAIVTRKLKFENQVQDYFDSGLGDMLDCAEYFEDYLLPQITAGLILELDEVDVLLHEPVDRAWVIDFFSMLRAWYDSKMNAHKEWKKLRIVLVHSREVNRETLNQKKSPFNVGREIELREFSGTQVEELAQRHGLSTAIAHEMMTLVGGHPQLLRQGLYAIARKQVSLEQLRENGATEAGFYGQHLEMMRGRIEEDEAVKGALRKVLATGETEAMIDLTLKAKLRSFGLVMYAGNGVRISCELYRQYFLALWS